MSSTDPSAAATPATGTLTVEEAARLLGISRTLAFEAIRQDGELAGVRIIRVGRRILIPRAALERVLAGE